ncbi:MAG: DUF3658 domain-containing protein, partial [Pseudomonadota bacterium]
PLVHIVFGFSSGGILRQVLRRVQSSDSILEFPDNLVYGPIANASEVERTKWVSRNLAPSITPSGEEFLLAPSASEIIEFWERFEKSHNRKVIWLSRRSSKEYCGFLECVYRSRNDEKILANDLTDRRWPVREDNHASDRPISSTSHLNVENMLSFFDSWSRLTSGRRKEAIGEWEKLRNENEDLRVFADGKLISAPISYFDESILSNVDQKWRKATRVLIEALNEHWDDYYNDVAFELLHARLLRLIDSDRVASRGNVADLTLLEIRKS